MAFSIPHNTMRSGRLGLHSVYRSHVVVYEGLQDTSLLRWCILPKKTPDCCGGLLSPTSDDQPSVRMKTYKTPACCVDSNVVQMGSRAKGYKVCSSTGMRKADVNSPLVRHQLTNPGFNPVRTYNFAAG